MFIISNASFVIFSAMKIPKCKQETLSSDVFSKELAEMVELSGDIDQDNLKKKLASKLFIDKLRKSLLSTLSESFDSDDFFQKLVGLIMDVSECDACSLWRINTPDATEDGNHIRIRFVSLFARVLRNGLKDKDGRDAGAHLHSERNFVHKYSPSFTEKAIAEYESNADCPYYICGNEDLSKSNHTCDDFIQNCEMQYVVGIPVKQADNSQVISLLKLYFQKKPENGLLCVENELLKSFSTIVSDHISHCYRLVLSQKKQCLLNKLMSEYRRGGETTLKELFEFFIKKGGIFQEYFNYEGASFFVWDDLNNYFRLCATTGLTWENGGAVSSNDYHKVFYTTTEGFTGRCANPEHNPNLEILIYDDFRVANSKHRPKRNPYEIEHGKNMMLVPISSPTNLKEVIGILRFVQKKHPHEHQFTDYFNNAEIEMFQNVVPYLALIIQGFLDKEKQVRQFARMTHEAYAPAQAISLDIERIIRFQDRIIEFRDDADFSKEKLFYYYRAIESLATVLRYQSFSTLLYSKISGDFPFHEKYPNYGKKVSIKRLLQESKTMVIPIARAEGVSFDEIQIHIEKSSVYGYGEASLYIDKTAFQIVIYNLLTNAIKYRKPENIDDFKVDIIFHANRDHYCITVADNGVGIDKNQKENIFIAGNRGGKEKTNIQGFGLGLYLARAIVKDFGGDIKVTKASCPTSITISLPIDLSVNARRD